MNSALIFLAVEGRISHRYMTVLQEGGHRVSGYAWNYDSAKQQLEGLEHIDVAIVSNTLAYGSRESDQVVDLIHTRVQQPKLICLATNGPGKWGDVLVLRVGEDEGAAAVLEVIAKL